MTSNKYWGGLSLFSAGGTWVLVVREAVGNHWWTCAVLAFTFLAYVCLGCSFLRRTW